jgi:hypothetical protein
VSTFLERFLKILRRSLGAILYRPQAGGIQSVGQTQRAIGKYNFIIDEQSIITLVFCFYNAM